MLMRIRPKQFVFPRNYKLKKLKDAFLFYSFLTFVVYFSTVLFPFQLEKFCLLGAAHTLRPYILLESQKQMYTSSPACYHLDLCLASMERISFKIKNKTILTRPPKNWCLNTNVKTESLPPYLMLKWRGSPSLFYLIYGWPLNCPFWIGA